MCLKFGLKNFTVTAISRLLQTLLETFRETLHFFPLSPSSLTPHILSRFLSFLFPVVIIIGHLTFHFVPFFARLFNGRFILERVKVIVYFFFLSRYMRVISFLIKV